MNKAHYHEQKIKSFESNKGPLIAFLLSNPKIILTILELIWRMVRFSFKFFIDKDGKPKRPLFIKVGKFLGLPFARELSDICEECIKTNEDLIKTVPENLGK